jgi:hypothetical protein
LAVTAPPLDTAGAALDAQIAAVQALVNANANPLVLPQLQAQLSQLQVEAVDHYMVTGWLNAGSNVLATYSAPAWDPVAQALSTRVAFLQNLYSTAPAMPPGNAEGYGGSGWTSIASNYLQQLYAAQIALVERLMDIGQPTAATILANLTGVQTAPAGITYQYVFSSVGFTDAWIDD